MNCESFESTKETERGKLPSDWDIKAFEKITVNLDQKRIPLSSRVRANMKGSVPYYGASGIIDWVNKHLLEGTYLLISEDGENLKSRKTPIAFLTEGKFWVNNHAHIVQSNKYSAIVFLYYWFKIGDISAYLSGSVQPKLSQKSLNCIKIPLPPIKEQIAIAETLSSIDALIDTNCRINKILERMSQTVFKRWFVDFEFPNEEGKPYKSSDGEMTYSEELEKDRPTCWSVKKLGAFIDLDKGLSYKGAFLSNQGVPMINLGTIASKAGFIPNGIKHYTGDYKERHLVKVGDIVVANTDITQKRDVLGSPAIVPPNLGCEKALFTHHIFAVRKKVFLPNLFIYYLLQLQRYRNRVMGFATGTTVLALPRDAILDLEFAVPDEQIVRSFENLASLINAKINVNNKQSTRLAQIRDMLLPKLMSGKIRIPVTKENPEATQCLKL